MEAGSPGNAGHFAKSMARRFPVSGLGQLAERNAEFTSRCSLDFSHFCNIRYVTHVFKAVSKNLTEAVMKYFVLLAMGQKIIGH